MVGLHLRPDHRGRPQRIPAPSVSKADAATTSGLGVHIISMQSGAADVWNRLDVSLSSFRPCPSEGLERTEPEARTILPPLPASGQNVEAPGTLANSFLNKRHSLISASP